MRAIALMGLRGSGKSTVGRRLAEQVGRPFVDLDRRALALLGAATVAEAWARHGEPAFRAAELSALERVLEGEPEAVVALGGGTGMIDGFEAVTEDRARLVYLRAEPEVLAGRISDGEADRPALKGESATGEMRSVFAERDPRYRSLAAVIVDASGSVEEVVERVLEGLDGDQAARA
jgi:shikimate kinase